MFGRSSRKPPSVKTADFDLLFDPKQDQWALVYRRTQFIFPGAEIEMPTKANLDAYLSWVQMHQSHIDTAVQKMVTDWAGVDIDGSTVHVACIEVEARNRIAVMVLGDESWGDLGYDLWIENGQIVDEGGGD